MCTQIMSGSLHLAPSSAQGVLVKRRRGRRLEPQVNIKGSNFRAWECFQLWKSSDIQKEQTMPTKNAASPQKTREKGMLDEWRWMFKWIFILGGVVARLANIFAFQNEFLISGLMLVGILMGIFYFDSEDVINIGLRYLIFIAVASSLGGFYKIGPYLNSFLTGFSYYQ